ncbi:peptide deformylase [Anoxybacillus sp. B7M1]|jgi:peptide deformylase|uniref:Peptide deformylase n=1 Tax=Anoxybacteroides rupiense TaxID=311460 RepID=A0ABD5IPX8_9BACL|nr:MULTISPECIES: peptide deformylase [Anoxybacillus]ANB58348.1 peptide deformylase [Anoxybacillus sp. B2M1]ANB63980.1 peptide deformylase [Anoxybacillus sp. B7M1]KXG10391.1 Peptide deformylase 2 [Anoxybacillus sp. P3H1B]MBB3906324.1 peptide deformylase [Anoxybacillus rupiensis]MBS2770691.1 peptide deformylase [Anoxybacillus rupiensis]
MITMKDIVREGHPALRAVAEPVALPASKEEQDLLRSMLEYLKMSQDPETAAKYGLRPGVGLAAPQINVLKRMIAVHAHDEKGTLYSYGLFNPKIISHSVQLCYLTSGEGCLSVDRNVPGYVPRYARITVTGTTLEGENITLRLKGYPAIVFQHEIDHLNGIMFYDHIDQENPFKAPENAIPIER